MLGLVLHLLFGAGGSVYVGIGGDNDDVHHGCV